MENTKKISKEKQQLLKEYARIQLINDAADAILLVCNEYYVNIETAMPLIIAIANNKYNSKNETK